MWASGFVASVSICMVQDTALHCTQSFQKTSHTAMHGPCLDTQIALCRGNSKRTCPTDKPAKFFKRGTAMSISIAVALLSGRSRVITAHPDSTVDDLRLQAQLSLKVGLERLVTETGEVGKERSWFCQPTLSALVVPGASNLSGDRALLFGKELPHQC